ncbi:MAG: methyltransferase domain-containing protein [Alphaproteobacteria bacterium]
MELTTTRIDDRSAEATEAKAYWSKPGTQTLHYEQTSHYAQALAELALLGGCREIFEFGCAAGRNLAAIRDHLQKEGVSEPAVSGVDINPESVEAGRETYGLEIALGDEQALDHHPDGSVDLAFTVSVLDHLPDPKAALDGLLRMTRRFAAFLEPFEASATNGGAGRLDYVESYWSDREDQVAPFTYLHDYEALFRAAGVEPSLVMPLPTHLNRAGPLYRLFVIDKAPAADRLDGEVLRDCLTQAVILQLLGNAAQIRTEAKKQKREAEQSARQLSKARAQLNGARIKGESTVRNQLPYRAGEVLIDHVKRPYMLPMLPWSLYTTYRNVRAGSAAPSAPRGPVEDAAPRASVPQRSAVTGLDELVLPRVSDPLLAAIRTTYNDTYQRELGVTQGRGFFRDADWRRINYAVGVIPDDARSALDVGVGAGVLLNHLTMSKRFERVVGIDIERHFNYLNLSNEVDWQQMSVCAMSFPDNHFDIVFCMEVLEHLEDEQFAQALVELRRVTRRRLVASVPFDEPRPLPSFHKQYFDKARISRVFPTASVTLLHKQIAKNANSRVCPWALMVEDQT